MQGDMRVFSFLTVPNSVILSVQLSSLSCIFLFGLFQTHSSHACGRVRENTCFTFPLSVPLTVWLFLKRGNEDTPYNVNHTMAYPKSKAKAEKMALEANGTKVINVSQHLSHT